MLYENSSDEHFRCLCGRGFQSEGRIIVVDRDYTIIADSAVLSAEEEGIGVIISPECNITS